MFDFFGKKHRQQLFDRAYAEFVSENHIESIRIATELISEDDKNYLGYNLRARCYSVIGKFDKAYHDAKKSIELEPNININGVAYEIRNNITKSLQSSTLNIYELLDFLSTKEVLELIVNNAMYVGKQTDSRVALWFEHKHTIKKLTLLIITFLYDKSIDHPYIINELERYKNAQIFTEYLYTLHHNLYTYFYNECIDYGGNPGVLSLSRPKTSNSEIDWNGLLNYQTGQPIIKNYQITDTENFDNILKSHDNVMNSQTNFAINNFVWYSNFEPETEFSKVPFYWLSEILRSADLSITRPYYIYNQPKKGV